MSWKRHPQNKYALNKSIVINLGETGIVASTARLPSQLITESRPDFEHMAEILLSCGFLLQERERTKDVCARLAPWLPTAPRLRARRCIPEEAPSARPRQHHTLADWSSRLATKDGSEDNTSVHPGVPVGSGNLLAPGLPCWGAPGQLCPAEELGRLSMAGARCFCSYSHCKARLVALNTRWLGGTVCVRAQLHAVVCTGTSASAGLQSLRLLWVLSKILAAVAANSKECVELCQSHQASPMQTSPGCWCTFHAGKSVSPKMGMWQLLCESLCLSPGSGDRYHCFSVRSTCYTNWKWVWHKMKTPDPDEADLSASTGNPSDSPTQIYSTCHWSLVPHLYDVHGNFLQLFFIARKWHLFQHIFNPFHAVLNMLFLLQSMNFQCRKLKAFSSFYIP